MSKKNDRESAEELVIKYLKKNKNLFLNHPELLSILNFPTQIKDSSKIIDLNAYRSKKIKDDYDKLKKQISEILKAGSSHVVSQKRILKTSLKVLNTKSLAKLINIMVNDLKRLLACDIINCFFTSNKLKYNGLNQIDNRVAFSYFRNKLQTNLNQNPKGILIFFPNKSKVIKSYILLKINYGKESFIVAMGSKDLNKFTKDQQVDLIEYLIQVIQIKLVDLKN